MAIRKRGEVPDEILIKHETANKEPIARKPVVNPPQPDPRAMSVAELREQLRIPTDKGNTMEIKYRERIVSPLTGIRAWCINCADGIAEARRCQSVECPLWPFRMGSNVFFNKKLPAIT